MPEGYGPINYNQSGADPFAAFDNRINYNDMVKQQMISQYAQNVVQPATMTLAQHRSVVTQQNFQYGTNQNQNLFRRRAAMDRAAYTGALTKGVMDFGMFEAGSVGAAAMGVSGFSAAGIALPLAAAMAPMHFVGQGINQRMQQQSNIHNIAADVGQYAGRLGFNNRLSYNQGSNLGAMMNNSMSSPGQFFSQNQQMAIHKIGLSNDLMSAKGGGMGSGSIQQYTKNFEELRDTTEEVVKLLKTTVEGGMSVIKELQGTGFQSMKQIRNQVIQAKAMGGVTGLGTQNMMQIGAAGAQAAQGTPYSAMAGSNMYQTAATNVSMMAQGDPRMAQAVARVGGTAAAGGVLANTMMNIASSGIGTKFAAYAMNPDGSINAEKMRRSLSGDASAYEISSGANATGYAMGEDRIRFGEYKEDYMNSLAESPGGLGALTRAEFSSWSTQRPGKFANRVEAFAGQFTNNTRDKRLLAMYLKGNPGAARTRGANRAASLEANMASYTDPHVGGISKFAKKAYNATAGQLIRAGRDIYGSGEAAVNAFSKAGSAIGDAFGNFTEDVGMSLGIYDQYGRDGSSPTNASTGLASHFGTGADLTAAELNSLSSGVTLSDVSVKAFGNKYDRTNAGIAFGSTVRTMGVSNVNQALEAIAIERANGNQKGLRDSKSVRTLLGISPEEARGMSTEKFSQSLARAVAGANEYKKQLSGTGDAYEKYTSARGDTIREKMGITLDKMIDFTVNGKPGNGKITDKVLYDSGLSKEQQSVIGQEYARRQSRGISNIFSDRGGLLDSAAAIEAVEKAEKGITGQIATASTNKFDLYSLGRRSTVTMKDKSKYGATFRSAMNDFGLDESGVYDLIDSARSKSKKDRAVSRQKILSMRESGGVDLYPLLEMTQSDFDADFGDLKSARKYKTYLSAMEKVKGRVQSLIGAGGHTGATKGMYDALKGIGGGNFNFGDFKKSGYLKILEGEMDMTQGALSSKVTNEASLIGEIFSNATGVGLSAKESKMKRFKDIQRAIRQLGDNDIKSITYDGKTFNVDEENREAKRTELKDELKALEYAQGEKDPASQGMGGGLSTTVRTPVLNYWNNSWSL